MVMINKTEQNKLFGQINNTSTKNLKAKPNEKKRINKILIKALRSRNFNTLRFAQRAYLILR